MLGSGTAHYESTLDILPIRVANNYYSMNLRTDYITGGTVTFTNITAIEVE